MQKLYEYRKQVHKIVWDDALSTGNQKVDDDHKHLIGIINRLFDEIEKHDDIADIEGMFQELEDYTMYHFEREEALMLADCLNYKDRESIEHHLSQHRQFIESIPKLKEKLLADSSKETAIAVVDFLAHWLIEHIIVEDLTLRQCFTKTDTHGGFMGMLVNKLSLAQRAYLIILIPFSIIILISGILSFNIYKEYEKAKEIQEISKVYICVNRLSSALQRERGLSRAYVSSNYSKFKEQLALQRRRTTEVVDGCEDVLKKNDVQVLEKINNITNLRLLIDDVNGSAENAIGRYTQLIGTLIEITKESSGVGEIIERLNAPLMILMSMKENYGLLRMEGAVQLQKHSPNYEALKEYMVLSKAYAKSFALLAPEAYVQMLHKIDHSENAMQVQEMQRAIIYGSKHNVDAKDWFQAMSIKIEMYADVIDQIVRKMSTKAKSLMQYSFETLVYLWSMLVVIIVFSILIALALQKSILAPIEAFTRSMQSLAKGDKRFFINPYRKDDAIGKMIAAFDSFRRSLIQADYATVLLEIQEQKADNYETLANMDPLTKAVNRRGFDEYLKTLSEKSDAEATPLSLLAIDLDHFKRINDTYGHDAGDVVLQKFVSSIHETIRDGDVFARVGGEEFFLLLPHTTLDVAVQIANRLLEKTQMLDFNDIDAELKLTASIGVSLYSSEDSLEEFQRHADIRLYKAKNSGRNRVVSD